MRPTIEAPWHVVILTLTGLLCCRKQLWNVKYPVAYDVREKFLDSVHNYKMKFKKSVVIRSRIWYSVYQFEVRQLCSNFPMALRLRNFIR